MKDQILTHQWGVIRAATTEVKRSEYLKYCDLAVSAVAEGRLSIAEASYAICGVGGQVIDHLLPEDEVLMDIACNLELPEAHRSQSNHDWQLLVARIAECVRQVTHQTEMNGDSGQEKARQA